MSSQWYLLQTKRNKEQYVCRQLEAEGIDTFCPELHVEPTTPLAANVRSTFTGYMFVCLDPDEQSLSAVEWLPGVQGLVKTDEGPVTIPARLIRRIRMSVGNLDMPSGVDDEHRAPADTADRERLAKSLENLLAHLRS